MIPTSLAQPLADYPPVATLAHAGFLEDLDQIPPYLLSNGITHAPLGNISCSYCGVGDGGIQERIISGNGSNITEVQELIRRTSPTQGCVKLRLSMMRQRVAYRIHIQPSLLDPSTGQRQPLTYTQGISRLAELVLSHRGPNASILIYACGQVDYFTIFAMQEVFRLLGVRNLTGNAEHCLNSGAVHNEILTGQEGPFLTIQQALTGPNRFYLLNGWNGLISHPPAFRQLLQRPDLDAYLVEVMVTESAKALAKQLDRDRILLIRPRTDAHLALAIGHEVFARYPSAIHDGFISRFSDTESFQRFRELACSAQFEPRSVADRIAPESGLAPRLFQGIQMIAYKLASPQIVPINIPSVGLSQTSGVVAHCLWGNVLAMLGKYGLHTDGNPAGGTLRIPGQINAETEVQGLSRKFFMGRLPIEQTAEAARRMDLPDDAYDLVLLDSPRAALDYSDSTPGVRELFICIGTQFESNMIGRKRWISKLESPESTLVVIDPVPDPYSEARADLILPSPPHPATTKLYQNGEWKLTLSIPQKAHPPQTRSDPTILYDMMAEITRRVESDPAVAKKHPDLAKFAQSGYLQRRFGSGLTRVEGEVSRPELWERIDAYMRGGRGSLYCRFVDDDDNPIPWSEILEKGSVYYGGIGTTRYKLDYDNTDAHPFRDIFRQPGCFKFFYPTSTDLAYPEGIVMNTGRSSLSDDRERIAFATATFNSGKATPIVNMPDEHPLFVSPSLAEKQRLKTGDRARVVNRQTGHAIELPVVVSDRVKGDTTYVSFHKSRAQMDRGLYINDVTSHEGRCPYSAQTNMKVTLVQLERATKEAFDIHRIDTTLLDHASNLPVWAGQKTSLYVTEIVQETHDVYTFRFQGAPLCKFVYSPGQYCSLVLNIDGKKVVRSYSISSPPSRPYLLEITLKRVPGGLVSNWLPDHLKVGDRVEITGPKGRFCLKAGRVPRKILLLGAGSGITPLMSMIRWLCDISADVDVRLVYSARTIADIIYRKELGLLASRHPHFRTIVTVTNPNVNWAGPTGRLGHDLLRTYVPELNERQVYMCGPDGFMESSRALLTDMGFNLANLHSESFGGLRTSILTKDAPLGSGAVSAGLDDQGAMGITFARSGKTIRTNGRHSLLDLAEAEDIDIDYGCRTGNCGDCKIKLLSGDVKMLCEDGLTPQDRTLGAVLSCVAIPTSDCVVDA